MLGGSNSIGGTPSLFQLLLATSKFALPACGHVAQIATAFLIQQCASPDAECFRRGFEFDLSSAFPLLFSSRAGTLRLSAPPFCSWHVRCSTDNMTIALNTSRQFDDSHFFQRLTLIDICCGPPGQN
jgi:hypothetical protein